MLFKREKIEGKTQVPVWFMRQAGRYHDHYQNLKKENTFMELCKGPELACEVTMGPIEEFDFDAAILFSDLLFPLEYLQLGLTYAPGPKLERHIDSVESILSVEELPDAKTFFGFQGEACHLLRKRLPQQKNLLGFVGAPWTLFTYGVEGGHSGNLVKAKKAIYDGRWERFNEVLFEPLLTEMAVQAENGADTVCLFDTAVGELCHVDYVEFILPRLKKITSEFKNRYPDHKIIYYSRNTHLHYLKSIQDPNIDVLGVDWRHDLPTVFEELSDQYMIQGNMDPAWLHLPWNQLERLLKREFLPMLERPKWCERWIFGLGHGVLQHTPVENVKNTVKFVHDHLKY